MELTILGTVGVAAFLLGGGAVLVISAFRRTIELRAALLHALKRIERLEQALSGGAPLDAANEPAPAALPTAPSPQPASALPEPIAAPAMAPAASIEEIAQAEVGDDKIEPPPLWAVCTGGVIAAAAAISAAQWGGLSPSAGVVFAAPIAALMIAAAEWRRRGENSPPAWRRPTTLTALLAFTIVVAATLHARWVLSAVHPPMALFLVAATALAASALSRFYGQALLGFALAAAALAPTMSPIAAPGSWPHYLFLLVFTALTAHRARQSQTPVWAWGSFALALFWALNALVVGGDPANFAVEGFYIAGLAMLGYLHAWDERGDVLPFPAFWNGRWNERLALSAIGAGLTGFAAADLISTHPTSTSNAALGLVALSVFAVGAAAARPHLWFAPLVAALATSLTIAFWPAANTAPDAPGILMLAAGLSLIFSIGGWAAMLNRDARPGAILAALAPLALFAAAQTRIGGFGPALLWAGAAAGLALIETAVFLQLRAAKSNAAHAFACGAVIALTLAASALFPAAYAPLVLAASLPLAALGDQWRPEAGLRHAAILLSLALLVRLLVPEIQIATATGPVPLMATFAPAAALAIAASLVFMRAPGARAEMAAQTLWAIGALIVALLVTLTARHLFTSGAIGAPYASLLEAAINTLTWLGLAALLAYHYGPRPRFFPYVLELAALVGAAVHALIVCGVLINPWWGLAPASAPGLAGLNVVALAYAAPGLGFLGYAALRARQKLEVRAQAATLIGLVLLLLAVTLEIRRLFHGALMAHASIGGVEAWTYSGALLGFAALMLAAFASGDSRTWRGAALMIAIFALAKMALSDIASLTGAPRVMAFLVLTAAMIGAGFLFRHLVLPAEPGRPKSMSNVNAPG